MFTGLVERTGRVVRVSGNILEVETSTGMSSAVGDSLSVDGTCLTVSSRRPDRLTFHCTRETLSRTIASGYHPGTMVNLEMPLEVGGRLHGHMVTGHVDCTASVLKVERSGGGATVWLSYPLTHARFLVSKGSVAVSGISLTVASIAPDRFSVALIPETMKRTTAGLWKPGSKVNLEFDLIGKYVIRQAEAASGAARLRENLE